MASELILEEIKKRAIAKWGDKWRLEITREYCNITGEGSVRTRSSQISRVFEAKGCSLETAIHLAKAVDCQMAMTCTELITF
jgi:hypothetical protein